MVIGRRSPDLIDQFREVLADCRRLYLECGQLIAREHQHLIRQSPAQFVALMDDLHKGLLVKAYVSVAQADSQWSRREKRLGQELLLHAWGRWLEGEEFREAALQLSEYATQLNWHSLVRPFAELEPLREHIGALESVFMRVANLVAKVDGKPSESELRHLRHLQQEFDRWLRPLSIDGDRETPASGQATTEQMQREVDWLRREGETPGRAAPDQPPPTVPAVSLEEALGELDELIGLEKVKEEVRTLANFLKLQQQRQAADLPTMPVSLHMVFTGNPGTGKTSVARILAKIYGAMKVLQKGHLVETDRSGLVAEYAGQTGPKTQRMVDQALDGVLFVDEAYSLVPERGEDAYGAEAIQALLKRMEDDRDRLIVVLAGYPDPMHRLLSSNPGLSSRFHRVMHFEDYHPLELAQIFHAICRRNHFELPAAARARLIRGLGWLYEQRDEHFGNGRLVRNLFEDSVRRLANRLASVPELSRRLLTRLEAEDITFSGVPLERLDGRPQDRFQVVCPGCQADCRVPERFLGRRVACRRCQHRFTAEWGLPE